MEVIASAGGQILRCAVKIKGKKIIAPDPGHQQRGDFHTEPAGPSSPVKKARVAGGTRGVATRVPEYKLTLAVAEKGKAELLDRGYEVVMTREKNDVNISNRERALLANKSGADLCVRLYAEGAQSASAAGASALYPSPGNPCVGSLSKKSRLLASCVLEMGFMTNPAEDKRMQGGAFQEKMAAGIADGIEKYYGA